MPDGTTRSNHESKPINHYKGCSTFSNFTALPEIASPRSAKTTSAAATTGVGAVFNTAKVTPGANVIVFGLGGIGLNVIQGARMAGTDKIVGVDLNDSKEEWGGRFELAGSCGVPAGGDSHPWSYKRSDRFANLAPVRALELYRNGG